MFCRNNVSHMEKKKKKNLRSTLSSLKNFIKDARLLYCHCMER